MRSTELEEQISPALLFDAWTGGRYNLLTSQIGENLYVIAGPGTAPSASPEEGDILIIRALGEGKLAWSQVLHREDVSNLLDRAGRLPKDRLVVRQRAGNSQDNSRRPDLSVRCVPPPQVLDRFLKDSAALTSAHATAIAALAQRITQSQGTSAAVHLVCVVGHADSSGDANYNQALALRRADNVKTALLQAVGLTSNPPVVFESSSRGETAPVAPNNNPDGQARNRRVEVFLNNRWIGGGSGGDAAGQLSAPTRIGRGQSAEDLTEDTLSEQSGAFDWIGAPGEDWTMNGSGTPMPPGRPGFTWSSSNPAAITVTNRNNDTQVAPNPCVMKMVAPGVATVTLTYRDSRNRTATASRTGLVARAQVSALNVAPTATPNQTGRNELSRPRPVANLQTTPAFRVATIRFEPASIFGGRQIAVRFVDEGTVRGTMPTAHPNRLQAQPGSTFDATTGRATLSATGTVELRINMPAVAFNRGRLHFESVDHSSVKGSLFFEVPGVVALDPGHGGNATVGGSSPNNATSVTGILEKNMTLDMMNRISNRLVSNTRHLVIAAMTRTADVNVGIADRAAVANQNGADILFVLHFNGASDSAIRGVETFIRETATNGNVNEAEDRALATRVQAAAVAGITGTNDRGVRLDTLTGPGALGVLRDTSLGNTAAVHPVRSAYMEMEFITNRDVDNLFNVNTDRETFKNGLAERIAGALIDDMEAQP